MLPTVSTPFFFFLDSAKGGVGELRSSVPNSLAYDIQQWMNLIDTGETDEGFHWYLIDTGETDKGFHWYLIDTGETDEGFLPVFDWHWWKSWWHLILMRKVMFVWSVLKESCLKFLNEMFYDLFIE